MKFANLKILLVLPLLIVFQYVVSQENGNTQKLDSVAIKKGLSEKTTIRAAGYVFIYTAVSEWNSKTNEPILMSPERHFFIPLKYMKSNLKETIESFHERKKNDAFLPIILTERKTTLYFMNAVLEDNVKVKPVRNEPLNIDSFYKNLRTKFSFKHISGIYKIAYIDGVWDVRIIPHKWMDSIPTGKYYLESLSLDEDHYTFYFLNKINILSFDLNIKDDSIELIKEK